MLFDSGESAVAVDGSLSHRTRCADATRRTARAAKQNLIAALNKSARHT
jgi:hypothetical protein